MASTSSSEYNFTTRLYKDIMPKVYGIGAAVVILGAMFKLLNWSGGALMLGVGLTTEAIIFILSAFEPHAEEVDWSLVYPELRGADAEGSPVARHSAQHGIGDKLDELFAQAKIDRALIERLGEGMQQLSDSVANMAAITDVAASTEKYTASVEKVADVMNNIYEVHADASAAISQLAHVAQDLQYYQEQSQHMVQTLQALGNAYQQELDGIGTRTQTTQAAHTHMMEAMEKMQAASNEVEKFEAELGQLSDKMAALNSIYGNMLTALKN